MPSAEQRAKVAFNMSMYAALSLSSGVLVLGRTLTVALFGYSAGKIMFEKVRVGFTVQYVCILTSCVYQHSRRHVFWRLVQFVFTHTESMCKCVCLKDLRASHSL